MAHPQFDTATQRPATGLDTGARELILRVVGELTDLGPAEVVGVFFRDRFGGREDYLEALNRVWGDSVGFRTNQAMSAAATEAEFPSDFRSRRDPNAAAAHALLTTSPEPDFRTAVSDTLAATGRMEDAVERIDKICRARGAPWSFAHPDGGS